MNPARDPAISDANGSTFEQLLEAAPDAIIGVDDKGKIVLVNSQTEALFGYVRADLLGREVEMLVPGRQASIRDGGPRLPGEALPAGPAADHDAERAAPA